MTTDPLPVEQIDDLWLELCEYTDRTSPEEYPDHALITRDELADFIKRATRPQPDREAIARVIEECAKIAEGWPDHGISKQSLWKLARAIRALEPSHDH